MSKSKKNLWGLLSAGVLASALCAAGDARADLRHRVGEYEVQVLVEGVPARTYFHRGETFVMGQDGDHYTVRVINHSGRRVEAVVSVDGRDVVDGRSADYRNKRGYLVQPYGQIDIEGWRVNSGQVAAFRFSDVPRSYAARTGSARDVGVVGVAVFPERVSAPLYIPPQPIPRPRRLPYDRYDWGPQGGDAPPPPATAPMQERKSAAPSAADEAPMPSGRASGGYVQRESERARDAYRPGLGTAYGEAVSSPAHEVDFVRQSPSYPAVVLGLRYNDREGLMAMGVRVDGYPQPWDDAGLRRTAEPFPNDRRYAPPPPGWNGY